ncbi:MAG: hypothetical protein ACT4PL_00540, partial [Phycisphaerales bacterium]
VAEKDSAAALALSDPGVVAGEFTVTIHPILASSALRSVPALAKATRERTGGPAPEPGKPPANIRAFVMVTAEDYPRARRALDAVPRLRTIWRAAFKENGSGLFVLDLATPEDARAALGAADTGPIVIDGWYSTTDLIDLPPL